MSLGGTEMSDSAQWKGYLISYSNDSLLLQSPYIYSDSPVYGPDSDSTTMTVAGIQYLQTQGHQISAIRLPDSVDARVVFMSTSVDSPQRNEELDSATVDWHVIEGDEATLVLSQSDAEHFEFEEPTGTELIDADLFNDMNAAWELECSKQHVSQGAYVSQSQYLEGGAARLSLASQKFDGQIIWPPRQMDSFGNRLPPEEGLLSDAATVESWTKLSAAGAPSEFSLRAPILGGIQTLLVKFVEGPRGVFLVCDDVDYSPNIGDKIEFGVRRIYAQEGLIRYGLKAIPFIV
jgi:uncharacterized OB-fold protein